MAVMTRKRRRMMEETAESPITILPKEVMIEILSRVDSSNTLQLRCVCNLWNSLVLDPQFAKNHIKKSCTEITVLLVKVWKYIKIFKSTFHHPELLRNAAARWDKLTNAAARWDNLGDREKNRMMKEVAKLDSLFEIAWYAKGRFRTLREDMQILEDRLKCLKIFLKIYRKSATSSSS
ncbi:putative F-box domain-containing protein [Medicago truncatula]|uniref:F-box-like protein n=1 Tax=Medicago truncatula TaxID=3880 RepID=G7IKF5_MEDTR|nr:F-box-like protein [Medicago truncatula]RHN72407.1 putative F-box domain-containing protein [Medicago truncatula]